MSENGNIKISTPYILIYVLHPTIRLLELTGKISKEEGMPAYRLCKIAYGNPKNDNIINVENARPAEFVNMFMNASYVITNSFHDTVFSINFNIPSSVVLILKETIIQE